MASAITDPDEATNRDVHAFNRALDRAVLRPVALGYVAVTPDPVERAVSNFSGNLGMPGTVLNSLLQGRGEDAVANTFRFAVNTVFGLGGLLDIATEAGLPERKADFGQTLHVWGLAEGPYVELPFLGPSTQRDALGQALDIALNPVGAILPDRLARLSLPATVVSRIGDRGRYSSTLDSILYDSADSYAQARLLYLQNRRYELGQTVDDADFEDPYEDPYGN